MLLKIRAERDTCCALPVETVVRDNIKSRRDKLLRIGLSYDLAHSKGRIVETEAEKRGRESAETRKKVKEQNEIKEMLMKIKNREKHLSNKAKKRAKAKNAKQDEKGKAVQADTTGDQNYSILEMQEKKQLDDKISPKEESTSNEEKKSSTEDPGNDLEEKDVFGAPPKADSIPLENVPNPSLIIADTFREPNSDEQISPKTPKTQLLPPPPANVSNECDECRSAAVARGVESTAKTAATSPDDDSDDESVASDVTLGTIESEINRKKDESESKKCPASPPCSPKLEEEDEFQRDPWNAWCTVGLRVYSKEAEVTIQIIRPKTWEDGETSLDVDDSAADATKHVEPTSGAIDAERPVELDGNSCSGRKASVMGFRGSIGSAFSLADY